MLYGGYAGSPTVPPDANANVFFLTTPPAGWSVDVILTYCSAARNSRKLASTPETIRLPAALALTADYGFTVPANAANAANAPGAARFGRFLLSPPAQAVFREFGFLGVAQ